MTYPREHNSQHEESLVRALIAPGRQEQFLRRLANPKTRGKILRKLAHFQDLDPRFAHRIPPSEQTTDKIYALLKGKGAPDTCYVMGDSELDGREVDLREALGVHPGGSGRSSSCGSDTVIPSILHTPPKRRSASRMS